MFIPPFCRKELDAAYVASRLWYSVVKHMLLLNCSTKWQGKNGALYVPSLKLKNQKESIGTICFVWSSVMRLFVNWDGSYYTIASTPLSGHCNNAITHSFVMSAEFFRVHWSLKSMLSITVLRCSSTKWLDKNCAFMFPFLNPRTRQKALLQYVLSGQVLGGSL